ncbi:MAG TPA: protein kinase [Hyalangium sp.]|nr:protein kinase [Hyalangium sp.]
MGGSTLPLALDAFSGRKMGKYEVLCRLSTGGMAEIFLASQRGLAGFRKLVVLKQILPDIAGEEEFVQMFLDEAKVTAAFTHPHIAQVFDLDVANGELFLAMEFVPGATLVEVAKACRSANEPIPIGFSLEAVRDTALALHYAHTFTDPLGRPSSVIHRDVAEKNIMVTYEGVTKLLDFGIAKNLGRRGRTQIGMVKGTNGYMSPEQILGETLDARSDLFSLGVVLHELLTGLRLFHAKTPEAGAGAILHGQVPAPSRSNKAVPPELDAIVLKALARKREDRYVSTLEFARALERAVSPLFWHPEQSAELIQRHFSERRDQTRQLLLTVRSMSGEVSGVVNVAQFLAPPPTLQPEPGTLPSLPQITPSLPSTPRPSLPSMPAVKPASFPSQEAAQPSPPAPPAPTPPRGAITRRTSYGGQPTAPPAESAAVRRAVFEPLPQKRAGPGQPGEPIPPPPQELTARTQPGEESSYNTGSASWSLPPPAQEHTGRTDPGAEPSQPGLAARPPPPPQEHTGRTDPGKALSDSDTPYRGDEIVTRAEPPEEPVPYETQEQVVSVPEVRTARLRVPLEDESLEDESQYEEPHDEEAHGEEAHDEVPPDDRTRPIRANLHLMGTIPMMEGLPPHSSPPVQEEPQEDEDSTRQISQLPPVQEEPQEDEDSTRQIRTAVSRVRPAFNEGPVVSRSRPAFNEGAAVSRSRPAFNEGAAVSRVRQAFSEEAPTRPSNPNFRAVRRAPTPAPPLPEEELPPQIEFGTEPAQAPALGEEEHVADTNETALPQIEPDYEEGTLVNAPAVGTSPPEQKRGGLLLVVLAVGVLLVGALGLVVALGLDGGRLMSFVSSRAPAPPAAPAVAPPEAAPSTPTEPKASPEPSPPEAAAPPASSSTKTAETAPPSTEPEAASPDSESAENSLLDAAAPPPPAKKVRPPPKATSIAAPAGTGVLTLVTDPYAKVYLGKRYLGDTPLFKINLPAGKLSLKLVGADGRALKLPVEIKQGETTALKLKLDEIAAQQ